MGHLRSAADYKITFAADLHQNLAKVDQFELEVVNTIDSYIQANGLNAPTEVLPQLRDGYKQPIIDLLDLKASGIKTVIWATGYIFDFSLVKLPVCDRDGFPIQTSGVTPYAGLYFVGIPWMPSEKSGFLVGVGESARHIVSKIVETDSE